MSTTVDPIVIQTGGEVYKFDDAAKAEQFQQQVQEGGEVALRLVREPEPTPMVARPLYDLEMHLAALIDSVETVSAAQEEEFLADFANTHTATKEKRDRVGEFMAACEGQSALAAAEIERLEKRKALYDRAVARVEGYVSRIIREKGKGADGKWQKLEGNTHTFSLKGMPPHVEIVDEAAVPTKFKSVSVTLPALLWEEVCDSLDFDLRFKLLDAVSRPNSAVSKSAVKEAIAAAIPNYLDLLKNQPTVITSAVPGAAIEAGGTKLVRS